MMVEFFANQVINYLKKSIEDAGQHIQPDTLFISPDSENAICCKLCDGGVSYWVISANPETNKFHLHQVVIDKENDCTCDDVFVYTTIKEVLEYFHSVAVQNAKWISLNQPKGQ
ncbi:UNVERIFIED_CONTAM: hypothetical protein RF648_17590 [Kocuria sp. CPCC 205274]|uniref:SH2 domain-containing protein n=1 Tax=Herbiconiux daphne TaxID=2970914 RepID=A0ABT2H8Y6_9MICO|nr:hypothetical protein [Herbiconiux daphne]MCS5736376.1 hypothetical protein [Herbiconiux daphne]